MLKLSSRLFILSLSILFISGCATQAPPLNFVPSDIAPNSQKVDADLKSITISVAKENERLGETQVGLYGNVYEQSFKSALRAALEESIARSATFNDFSNKKVSLMAKVMKFQTPNFSSNFMTEMIIRYELIDRQTGDLVFFKDITSHGSVSATYSAVGAIRYTEARNRSVQENVTQLINTLATAPLQTVSKEQFKKHVADTFSKAQKKPSHGKVDPSGFGAEKNAFGTALGRMSESEESGEYIKSGATFGAEKSINNAPSVR